MTRDKSNSDYHRDSVNDGVLKDSYLGTKFQMHYSTVDTILHTLNELGTEAKF